jgi:hypothetical protein
MLSSYGRSPNRCGLHILGLGSRPPIPYRIGSRMRGQRRRRFNTHMRGIKIPWGLPGRPGCAHHRGICRGICGDGMGTRQF